MKFNCGSNRGEGQGINHRRPASLNDPGIKKQVKAYWKRLQKGSSPTRARDSKDRKKSQQAIGLWLEPNRMRAPGSMIWSGRPFDFDSRWNTSVRCFNAQANSCFATPPCRKGWVKCSEWSPECSNLKAAQAEESIPVPDSTQRGARSDRSNAPCGKAIADW